MNGPQPASTALLFALVAVAVGLVAAVAIITRIARVLPIRRAWRRAVERWTPIAGSVLGLGYLGWALTVAARGRGIPTHWMLLGYALLLVAIAWSPLRDVAGGLVWRAARGWREGDPIKVGELNGRLVALGYRTITLETDRGERALVPYSLLLREAVTLRGRAAGDIPHQFTVNVPAGASIDDASAQLARALSLCHGTSVLRGPRVQPAADRTLEVTVFVLARELAPQVEARARRAMEGAVARGDDAPAPADAGTSDA